MFFFKKRQDPLKKNTHVFFQNVLKKNKAIFSPETAENGRFRTFLHQKFPCTNFNGHRTDFPECMIRPTSVLLPAKFMSISSNSWF